MKKINLIIFLSIPILCSCNISKGVATYSCKGELIESHFGSVFGNKEYKFIDSVSLHTSNKGVEIKGPTELKVPQYFDKDGASHLGYIFSICSKDKEFFYFNNYNCLESNKYPTFEIYEGEFNSLTKKLVIQTRNVSPNKDMNITQKASYLCKLN